VRASRGNSTTPRCCFRRKPHRGLPLELSTASLCTDRRQLDAPQSLRYVLTCLALRTRVGLNDISRLTLTLPLAFFPHYATPPTAQTVDPALPTQCTRCFAAVLDHVWVFFFGCEPNFYTLPKSTGPSSTATRAASLPSLLCSGARAADPSARVCWPAATEEPKIRSAEGRDPPPWQSILLKPQRTALGQPRQCAYAVAWAVPTVATASRQCLRPGRQCCRQGRRCRRPRRWVVVVRRQPAGPSVPLLPSWAIEGL
jgi:hypothetical protein